MSSQEPSSKQPTLEISYTRLSPPPHPDGKDPSHHVPIVFLHGLELCRMEFSRTTPFLSKDYELILVDLPGHSMSRNIPFTLDNAIEALSHLISTKVAGRRAHIVGMSLGGVVGLELARRRPELVLSLFCTGCAPPSGFRRWIMSRPRLLGGVEIVLGKLASDAMFWYSLGVEPVLGLREEFRENQSMALLRVGYSACTSVTLEDLAEIRGVRVAIVAGGKRDSVEQTREIGRMLRSKDQECMAFVVIDAVHLWDLQFPKLFAQGVRAWADGSEMPKEFKVLE
jgi:pimeloyl-ACP methyl ester carboxylesterase